MLKPPRAALHSLLLSHCAGSQYLCTERSRLRRPHLRTHADGWVGTLEEWRAQEPENAHAHLLAMLTGSSESIPVVDGQLMLGTWQSVLLLDLDGPRTRKVALQFSGLTAVSANT